MAKLRYPDAFRTQLIEETPNFAADCLSLKPANTNYWLGYFETGKWGSYEGDSLTYYRRHTVDVNPYRPWVQKTNAECTTCEADLNKVGLGGSEAFTIYPEAITYTSDPVCFDAVRDYTRAQEEWNGYLEEVFMPAADLINSHRARVMAATHFKNKWVANNRNVDGSGRMQDVAWVWAADADGNMVYLDINVDPDTIFKLTPQMLQRRYRPLLTAGYATKGGVTGNLLSRWGGKLEVVIDEDTIWDLDKQLSSGTALATGTLAENWRFKEWGEPASYWESTIRGRMGDNLLYTDPGSLRFQSLGRTSGNASYPYRLQVIPALIYEDVGGTSGIGKKSTPNPAYESAQIRMGMIRHKRALKQLFRTMSPLNSKMPFMIRELAGKVHFYMPKDMTNFKQNMGVFWFEFEHAWKPQYTELADAFLYRGEPACIYEISTCNDEPNQSYPVYEGANDECDDGPWEAPDCDGNIELTSVTISGIPASLGTVTAAGGYANIAALVVAMNADTGLSGIGTWAADDDGNLELTNPNVSDVEVTIECVALG